jgi:hypothetical protein
MRMRRNGWRRVVAIMAVAGALAIPSVPGAVVFAQATATPLPATRTALAMQAAARAGEPVQDATMAALILGAMVVGGLTLRRFAERRG